MAKKNVYVVTGGAGGIGLAAAKQLNDGIVIISDVVPAALERGKKILNECGIEAVTRICDISDRKQVREMAAFAASLGRVKGVVHSAGVSGDVGRFDLVVKIDLLGTYYIVKEFLEVMEEGGAMVFLSSMMADVIPAEPERDTLLVSPDREDIVEKLAVFCNNDPHLAYDMTKRGVRLLVKAYAPAYGKKGARINSISPGVILTDMAKKAAAEHPEQMKFMESVSALGRNGEPEEIASVIAFLCSEKASFITGADIRVDGGAMHGILEYKKKAAAEHKA